MANIAIVTDSTAYLPPDVTANENITIVPLSVVFGNEAYEEEVELSTVEFYNKLKQSEDLPTTSQPALGKFVETYERLAQNHEAIITIHLASGISGTYQTALTAGEQVEGVEVYGFDSEISCMPQGYFVIEAARMARDGETVDTILDRLKEMKKSMDAYFVVDNLNHLHRGGRLNGAQALIGSLLQIKPILTFENQQIVPFEKVRTEKKALNRVFELFDEAAKNDTPIRATVIHANRRDKAEEIQQKLSEKYPNAVVDISCFGPVIGTHLGEGSLGVGWCKM
ncbi:DegV family protein [Alteribacillus sp. JSM 102045]|uniref:DegV family protein n=1 Tax=Alteribacillus sp. JSM 102045 TaxID=1562101 RepID=UPI0035BF0ADB